MAGYSHTPLAKKLGIQAGHRVLVIGEPAEFQAALGELPPGVERTSSLAGRVPVQRRDRVRRTPRGPRPRVRARDSAHDAGGERWIAWPKRSSGIVTDVTEDVLRAVLLPIGWVDNKVCAIDERWSGLRFVLHKELRPVAPRATKPKKAAPKASKPRIRASSSKRKTRPKRS